MPCGSSPPPPASSSPASPSASPARCSAPSSEPGAPPASSSATAPGSASARRWSACSSTAPRARRSRVPRSGSTCSASRSCCRPELSAATWPASRRAGAHPNPARTPGLKPRARLIHDGAGQARRWLREATGEEWRMQISERTPALYIDGNRVRKSPYWEATERHGCLSYDVYNHMYIPGHYADPVEEYWQIVNHVALWDVAVERCLEISGRDGFAFANR